MEWRFISILSSTKLYRRRPKFAILVRTVNLSFRKFEYSGFGEDVEKSAILMLHGILGNKKHWESIAKTVCNITKKSVMTLDVRNHGDSPHTNSHRYTECAVDVEEFMNKQGIKKAILLGYCMGGRIAMSLSLMKPDIVSGLIVVEISPVSTCSEMINDIPILLGHMQKIDFSDVEKKKVAVVRKYVKKQLRGKVTDEILLNAILSNIDVRKGVIGWTCNLEVLIRHYKYIEAFPITLLDKTYSGPTLFIGGQKSDFLPPDDLPRIREMFPNSTVLYVPKTGHRVYIDDPKRFLELIINFVNKNTRSFSLLQPYMKTWYNTKQIVSWCNYSTKAVDVAHKIYGNLDGKAPIIILHGLLGMKRNWNSMSQKLKEANNRTVIAVDMRNHGESPHATSHQYTDLAADIKKLIEKHKIKEAIMLGHSMGGRTAMALALTEPAKVSNLIVVDISPVHSPSVLSNFFPRLISVMKSIKFNTDEVKNVANARELAKHKLERSGLEIDSGTLNFVLMNVGKKGDRIGWTCNMDALKKHFNHIATFPTELAGKVYNRPTLFICGANSKFVPPDDLDGIKVMFPLSEVKFVENAGHNVHIDQPDVFISLVKSFISEYGK